MLFSLVFWCFQGTSHSSVDLLMKHVTKPQSKTKPRKNPGKKQKRKKNMKPKPKPRKNKKTSEKQKNPHFLGCFYDKFLPPESSCVVQGTLLPRLWPLRPAKLHPVATSPGANPRDYAELAGLSGRRTCLLGFENDMVF